MKTVGIILALCVLQALALPKMEMEVPESEKAPKSAEQIRENINFHFGRFNEFYDAVNEAMSRYRLEHVGRIRENYIALMEEFGAIITAVRLRGGNQYPANMAINACAARANASLSDALSTYFYPTFRLVQDSTSVIPMYTLDALRRGNLFVDEEEIMGYLEIQYEAYLLMWLQTVSKFFRWEKEKTDVTGDFYIEEMNLCLCTAVPEGLRCAQNPLPTFQKLM